jgi:hypothetical protein
MMFLALVLGLEICENLAKRGLANRLKRAIIKGWRKSSPQREAARKENPMGEKHYVYSARTTKDGLAVLNKARGDRGWDSFVSEAVAEHYGLDLNVIALPPSKFLEERKAKREAREAEKAAKKAERDAKLKAKAGAKKAAAKKSSRKVEKPAKKAARQVAEAKAS